MDKLVENSVSNIVREARRLGMGGSALSVLSPFVKAELERLVRNTGYQEIPPGTPR